MFKEINRNSKKQIKIIVMEKEFIPYEQSLDLQELKFDEPCFGFYLNGKVRSDGKIENCLSQERVYYIYNANCLAPTYQQAFRWFREKYKIFPYTYTGNGNLFHYCMFIKDRDNQYHSNDLYLSNEEAELECLKKLIEIVKQK